MDDFMLRSRYLTTGIMRGAYLTIRPREPGVVPCPLRYRHKGWLAVYPHEDGTWYEGPKREDEAMAHGDLKAYVELIEWLKQRAA